MVFSFLFNLVSMIMMFLGVAFYTLLERKILGLAQSRIGPNKVGVGILQPITDALKLLTKPVFYPVFSNKFLFFLAPSISLTLSLILFWTLQDWSNQISLLIGLVFILIISLSVFPPTMGGLSSNSTYSRVGGTRSLAQSVSYEVALFLALFSPLFFCGNLFFKSSTLFLMISGPVFIAFFLVLILSETNRAPFDLSEGESELVSGFNIEYGGAGFTLYFLSEYATMLTLSGFSSLILGLSLLGAPMFAFVLLMVRACYPRLRYDTLMVFLWGSFLPLLTVICILIYSFL